MCYVWVPYLIAAVTAAGSVYQNNQNVKKQTAVIQEQVNAQASDESDQVARQARQERARIRAAAAESGVQGASFEDALNQSFFNEDQNLGKIQNLATRSTNAQLSGLSKQNYGVAIGTSLVGAYANNASFGRKSDTGLQLGAKSTK